MQQFAALRKCFLKFDVCTSVAGDVTQVRSAIRKIDFVSDSRRVR
jgi:hypothetical protein